MMSPARWRSSGTWLMPRARRDRHRRGVRQGDVGSVDAHAPAASRMPPSTSSNSDWPLPATPAIPRISPARTERSTPLSRSTPFSSVDAQVLDLEHDAPGLAGVLSTRKSTLRPTISSASASGLVPDVLTVAVISPRRMTLTMSVISMISRSLWVIRTMVFPSRLQPGEDAEEVVRLGGRQHARGLVEDQDVGLAVERLQDLHPLLVADRKRPRSGVGIDVELVVRRELA